MPRRKQHVQEMEKYETKVPPSVTKITLGPMFTDWEAQKSAGGFGPTCQQQWIKHLLEVHSLACNGQGCARMYEGTTTETQENTTVNKSRGRPRGSTSPRSTSPRNPGSPGRSRGRPRKASSPHRNTSMYVESVMDQEEQIEQEEEKVDLDAIVKATANGENGHHDDKEHTVSSSEVPEIDGHLQNQDVTRVEDIGDPDSDNLIIDSEACQTQNNVNETVTFKQVKEEPVEESKVLEQASIFFNNRLHELYPQAAISQQQSNNMPIDLTTRMMGYPFPNFHTPPSSPSTTTSSSEQSTLPPTAEYKEVRLRRGNGYYIREYIYIKNRDCNGKIFLRCQFRASCRARAVVLIDTGRVIVTQGRHTHPPPHPQMIRFGPHIKDISATWANRVHKREGTHVPKLTMKHHHNLLDQKNKNIHGKHIKKEKTKSPKVITQMIRQQGAISQTISGASSVVTVPTTSVVPVAAYKFTPQFTNAQGNNFTAAANNIINVQQPLLNNVSVANTKGDSGMPLIVKSWSLLKNMPQNTASIITQPLNVLQGVPGGKTCLVLQPNPPNSAAGMINVVSQPQVSLAYNFNPGAIISQPVTTFAQSNLMQRVVINPANINQIDQNATNLSLKDNQFILNPGISTGDALNTITVQPQPTSPLPVQLTPTVQIQNGLQFNPPVENGDTITIQPEPTSPLPVQLTAVVPFSPENGGLQDHIDQQECDENSGSVDLTVGGTLSEVAPVKSGKKRANISSITEKLMKQKQQRLSVDE